MTVASVHLWGTRIGAVRWDAEAGCADFEYDSHFVSSGIQVAPITMPLEADRIWRFPSLPKEAFQGLPGLLADSLPDRYGNALIDAWLAREGRAREDFDPVQRLCYVGRRAMGALTFDPAIKRGNLEALPVDLRELVEIANMVLGDREAFRTRLSDEDTDGLSDILRVGTSAGGARPKAVIAWNEDSGEVRSGQVDAPKGFEQWLLKFDGVDDGGAASHGEDMSGSSGFGALEYAYAMMAAGAGVEMESTRLFEEHGRRHFMTRRFDRTQRGNRVHALTLGGMAHFDYNHAGGHSYEQAFEVMETLGLPKAALEQQFRRMVFNVVARNQDDHVKNITFLMDRYGRWTLSPAYDMTYAYNPEGVWTSKHQMTIDGEREDITREHLRAVGRRIALKRGRADRITDEVVAAVKRWPKYAREARIPGEQADAIAACHRLDV